MVFARVDFAARAAHVFLELAVDLETPTVAGPTPLLEAMDPPVPMLR